MNDDFIEGLYKNTFYDNRMSPYPTFPTYNSNNFYTPQNTNYLRTPPQTIIEPPITQNYSSINNHINNNISTSHNNKKSITFRNVGPNIDSTVDSQGTKYTEIIKQVPRPRVNSGFYGRTRLTRI